MTPIFFLNLLHPCHGGVDRPSGISGGRLQTPQTAIHTPKATQFSLSTFNIGKDPSSCPKIANDTHLFSQPTSSMPGECRLAIWDPGGTHQTPQTSMHTPKATQFSLSTFNVGKDPFSRPKIANDTHFCLDEISFRRDYKSCRVDVVRSFVVRRSSCHIYGNFAMG